MGTRCYMAPEVFQQKAYTLSADVYAIGRLLLFTTCVPVAAEKLAKYASQSCFLQHILRASFAAEARRREPEDDVRLDARA